MENTANIRVDSREVTGALEHYWRYIGYDECNYTYIPEGLGQLKKFRALEDEPYFVRTHFMFCTGNCHGTYKFGSTNLYTEDEAGNPVYDYEVFDRVIDTFLSVGHKPFVELGFMPKDLADYNFLPRVTNKDWYDYSQYKDIGWACPPKDYQKWYELIENLAKHLKEKYGQQEMKTWYFELWNEPDIFYWRGTPAEYCKLFDYTENAFHAVLPEVRLSGPAVTGLTEGGGSQQFLNFFLTHCRDGANFCTNQKGTRLDFITFHVKGGGFPFAVRAKKAVPSVKTLLRQVKLGLDCIVQNGYADREVVLSEADPDGWAAGGVYDNANMIFRNTEYYATYVASIYDKIEAMGVRYGMKVRPLAWAFLFPGERCFEGTRTFSTQGIDKAVFNMFRIFGRLGHEKLAFSSDAAQVPNYTLAQDTDADGDPADISGFAVRGGNAQTQIVLYSHHDDRDKTGEREVVLCVTGYGEEKGLKIRHYRIDKNHSNAYAQWIKEGSPMYPDEKQYAAMKAREVLEQYLPESCCDSQGNELTLRFSLPTHAVSFIEISR